MLLQRFGSVFHLNLYIHMPYLNGLYDSMGSFWAVEPVPGEFVV